MRDRVTMEPELQSLPFIEKAYHFTSIDSTNTFAKSLDSLPVKGMHVIAADRQTAGRGQRDNTFFSDTEGGLYASIVCPIPDISRHFRYNRAISLAICTAIEGKAPLVKIKWPNDIYWSHRKICGILLESLPHSARYLVVGFGVNVNIAPEQFPPSIRDRATSVMIETGRTFDCAALLYDICRLFHKYLGISDARAHAIYRNRLYKKSSRIAIHGHTGIFHDVFEDGRLCLISDTATVAISSGTMQFID